MSGLTFAERITLCVCTKRDGRPDRCKRHIAAVERLIASRTP